MDEFNCGVLLGMILKAGTRVKVHASPDRARLTAKGQKMGSLGGRCVQESGSRLS